jgi:hypothetical protein
MQGAAATRSRSLKLPQIADGHSPRLRGMCAKPQCLKSFEYFSVS